MSIYVFECNSESGDEWLEGYFTRKLTEEEQHGYFKDHYEYSCDEFGDEPRRCVYWRMVELEEKKIPAPLPKSKWSSGF